MQVIPLTSNIEKLYPCEAYVTVNEGVSKAMADQIATVSKQRLRKRLSVLTAEDMIDIERIIRVQLGL